MPGFAFAAVVARAFANYAWPADVRGVETDRVGGGLVDALPLEPFHTDPDHVWSRSPVEIVWNDHQERELLDAGLMPLSAIPYSDELVFGAVRSLLVPQRFTGATAQAADANARLSSQINSILCASRFAHYLKMQGRQMVGSFKTADEIERRIAGMADRLRQRERLHRAAMRARAIRWSAGRVTVQRDAGEARQLWLHRASAAALSARRRGGDVPACHRSRRPMMPGNAKFLGVPNERESTIGRRSVSRRQA